MADGGSGGYQVNTDELAAHANAVRQVVSTLDQALSAAEQVTMGVQAYGMICGPLFVPMVLAVSTPGLVTLGLSRQAMNSMAGDVEQAAASYTRVDQAHANAMKDIDGGSR